MSLQPRAVSSGTPNIAADAAPTAIAASDPERWVD